MKIQSSIGISASKSLLGIIVLASFCIIFAQSGRVIPPTPPIPPGSEVTPSKVKPPFVPDPNAVKYKLVFAKSIKGKMSYTPSKELEAYQQHLLSHRENFLKYLNTEGAVGYRLISTTIVPHEKRRSLKMSELG